MLEYGQWYCDFKKSMTSARNVKLEPWVINLDTCVSVIIFAYNHVIVNNILGDVLNNIDVLIHQDECILLKKKVLYYI